MLFVGRVIEVSGLAKRASRWVAWAEEGVSWRRLRGRCERGSADVGTDSGIGSDILREVERVAVGK